MQGVLGEAVLILSAGGVMSYTLQLLVLLVCFASSALPQPTGMTANSDNLVTKVV